MIYFKKCIYKIMEPFWIVYINYILKKEKFEDRLNKKMVDIILGIEPQDKNSFTQ